jgi:hypothetical protein
VLKAFFLLFLAVFVVFPASSAHAAAAAASVVPASCDPDFMEVVKTRAWMEGNREMEAAQKLILKPDSVMQYTCFDQRMGDLASTAWSNVKANMAAALAGAVYLPLSNYYSNNFNHTMGGGTTSVLGNTCDTMNQVWQALKCANADTADFWTFEELALTDFRTAPLACSGFAARNAKWAAAILVANPVPAVPPASGGMAQMRSWANLLSAPSCNTLQAVATGLKVRRLDGTTYDDRVCATPGCYYPGSGTTCQ